MKRKNFLCAMCALLCIMFAFALVGCGSKNDPTPITSNDTRISATQTETVNGVEWSILYYNDTNEIISISASYSENEQTSTYYKKLAYRYGDNSVYVTHQYSFIGTPIGDNWYAIESVEKAFNGWNGDEIFYERRTRYDERVYFDFLTPEPVIPDAPPVTENTRLKFILDSTGELVITNENIADASLVYNDTSGCYAISLIFDTDGSMRIALITSEHIGETMSIVVVDKNGYESTILSPTIGSTITNGKVVIDIQGDYENANDIYGQIVGLN